MRDSQKQTGKKYAQFSAVGLSNMLVDVGALNLLLFLAPTGSPELLGLRELLEARPIDHGQDQGAY